MILAASAILPSLATVKDSEATLTTTDDNQVTCDILVNGGGMVGLGLALALAGQGFKVVVLDAQAPPADLDAVRAGLALPDFDSRVSAITLASQSWLQQLGVWDELAGLRVCAYRDMRVWDADGTGAIHFAAEEVHKSCLGHIVENRLICSVLYAALQQHPEVRLYHNHSLVAVQQTTDADASWIASCDNGLRLRSRLLVGADGGNSLVRSLCNFATRHWSYKQQAIVATIKSEQPHQFTAWQRFMTSGPLAVLPLLLPTASSQHYSSIVWSCDNDKAAKLMALTASDFQHQLQQSFENRLGHMELLSSRVAFPLQQQHAIDYAKPGVALVGDAAHTIHPLAGQGVNLGFTDAQCLAKTLGQAVQRGEDFACFQTLSRYQRERKGSNLGMMIGMEAFNRLFGSDALMLRWLRNTGLKLADQHLPLKQAFIYQAMGLSG